MGILKRSLFGITLFGVLSLHAAEKPHEELMVVQTVSKNRGSFVINKGIKEGVIKGQEVIFANENVSILCKAQEVNRSYSLWIPIDRNITIPFNKEDFVSYNTHAYGNVALDIVGDINNLTPEVNYEEIFKKFRSSNTYSLKGSYEQGLSQSSSDVSADNNSKRTGYNFTLDYNYRFLPEFEMSGGIRYDSEIYRLNTINLDIPTNRIMGTISATYHLTNLSKNKNNFYLSLAAGIGKSTTTVNGSNSTGIVTLLPEARVGYLMPFSPKVAMIFEGAVESLNAHESFKDSAEQVTSILNVKFTLGLRF